MGVFLFNERGLLPSQCRKKVRISVRAEDKGERKAGEGLGLSKKTHEKQNGAQRPRAANGCQLNSEGGKGGNRIRFAATHQSQGRNGLKPRPLPAARTTDGAGRDTHQQSHVSG
ncbi:hypothetical protein chiPu_0011632 [Chiloscyllium punctatum]|uniref:Uncharacterized protein n=1 Tax=Chiloscyllium punctatum TaxID=137246 RepID=A0A401SRY4_CHIPU|nr:hypothetical protein [Chiloscyllium punctatum]